MGVGRTRFEFVDGVNLGAHDISKERNKLIVNAVLDGQTYAAIAREHLISIERCRQIFFKYMRKVKRIDSTVDCCTSRANCRENIDIIKKHLTRLS